MREGPGTVAAVATSVGLVTAVGSWLRLDATTRATVWAEDGLFLADRRAHGPLATLLDPYAGYLHLVPRLVVDAATVAPLELYARVVTALCCLVVGLVAALVVACSGAVVADLRARAALGLVTLLVPAAPIEVLGNTANLHWWLLWLSPWLLLCAPTRRWHTVALTLAALAVTLTEIQAALFLPLVLLARGDRLRRPVAAAYAAGLVAQVAVTLLRPRPDAGSGTPGVLDLAGTWLLSVVWPVWRPSIDGPGPAFAEHGWGLAVLAAVPFVLVLGGLAVAAVLRRERTDLVLVAVLAVGAVVPPVAGVVLNFADAYAYAGRSPADLAGDRPLRYGVVGGLFLLAAVVVAADRLLRRATPPRVVLAAGLVVGALALGLLHVGGVDTRRSKGPVWADGLAAAADGCAGADPPADVAVRAAPRRAGWQVVLPCADLR